MTAGPRPGGAYLFERRSDGSLIVTATAALGPYPAGITAHLVRHARASPERTFLARRGPDGGWERLTYADALARVERIAAAFLARGLSAERPLMVLSGNGFEHALASLAALHAGVAVAPVSPAYSTLSQDHARLREIVGLLTPGLVLAVEGARYARAVAAAVPAHTEVATLDPGTMDRPATALADLEADDPGGVARAYGAVGPDTIAKFLFTSGSTGIPKAVITTHGMLSANQAMLAARYPFLAETPPVLVDWLPWHHVFGGSHNFNIVLAHGGTLYIDEGRPVPALFGETVRNLREVAPTLYLTVPKGFEALVPHLRHDRELRERFFSRLQVNFYAAAGLPQPVWDALDALALETVGRTVPMLTGLGATETAPFALVTDDGPGRAGQVGLPAAGLTLKLAPVGAKMEARVKGPNVTPGYWRRPDLSAAAFDAEGFYRLGDALIPVDPADLARGFLFDGRLNEDFKLTTGIWVSVGPLRAAFLDAFAPLVRDVAIAGEERDTVAALVFPDLAACRELLPAGEQRQGDDAAVLADPIVRRAFAARLALLGADATGSSNRVTRLRLLAEPPALDRDEVTDKGSINQRAVLRGRAADVEALYADRPASDIVFPQTAIGQETT